VSGATVYATCTVLSSVMISLVTDRIIVPRFEQGHVRSATVLGVLALLLAVAVVRAAGVVARRTFAARTAWRVAEDITGDVVDRVVAQPVPWQRKQSTGDVITRAGVDAEAATMVLHPLPFASSVVFLVIISTIWLLVTDWVLGLIAVALFPLLITLNVVYQRRVDQYYDEAQRHLGDLSSAVHESFEGVTVVKSFGAERRETERLSEIAARLRGARLRVVDMRSLFESLLELIPNLANITLLVAGAYRVRSGQMSLGELTSFIYLFTLLVFPLRLIGFALSEMPHSMSGYRRITELLDQPLEADPGQAVVDSADASLALRNVGYSHDGQRTVLDGLNAHIPAGRSVAVVGATGAGKTTILHLLGGLIGPE
ncbi:MAG TPA: ABC transporter ATP-binding protein, partial [Ilumatobacteraceae bacterium]|nr:ABC transporter ATP-binding protein [Ilumatobacteraceae bacterium]